MAATEAQKKSFYAKVTILSGKPGGGGDGGDGGDGGGDGGNGGDGGGNGGDGGDGGNGGNGGDGGAVHPGPEPIPPGGLGPGGVRPRGFRTVEFDPDEAPQGKPSPPGKWVVVDAGRGKPPVFGFMGQDHGLEGGGDGDGNGNGDGDGDGGDKPESAQQKAGAQTSQQKGKSGKSGDEGDGGGKLPSPGGREAKGHYVAIQYPMKAPKSAEPVFVWIPQIDEKFGVKHKSGNGNGNGNGNGEED